MSQPSGGPKKEDALLQEALSATVCSTGYTLNIPNPSTTEDGLCYNLKQKRCSQFLEYCNEMLRCLEVP